MPENRRNERWWEWSIPFIVSGHYLAKQNAYLGRDISRLREELKGIRDSISNAAAQDASRDLVIGEAIMASIDDVIAKATEAKTVSESTNIAVREALRLLREGQAGDSAKFDEAVALLEAMRADDAAMLTENTPAATE